MIGTRDHVALISTGAEPATVIAPSTWGRGAQQEISGDAREDDQSHERQERGRSIEHHCIQGKSARMRTVAVDFQALSRCVASG